MKWIGQHIWDFISRFRSDVYLEAIETGTIASGGNLGLDSNNKIVKADTESGELSFDGSTANGILTYKDADEISVESSFTYDSSFFLASMTSSSSGQFPQFQMRNENSNNIGPVFKFIKTDNGSADDELGSIVFMGDDDGGNPHTFAEIASYIGTATAGSEAGRLEFAVAENDGTVTTGLKIEGQASDDGEVDVTIGAGAASTTTIAGDLDIDGDAITAAGNLTITPAGGSTTINSSLITVNSSAISTLNLNNTADDAVGPIIQLSNSRGGADADDNDKLGTINFTGLDDGTPSTQTYGSIICDIADATSGQEAGRLRFYVAEYDGTSNTVGLELDGDTNADGEIDVTIGAGAASTTTIAGNLTTNGESVLFTSSTSQKPVVEIRNTTSDGNGPELKFNNTNAGGDASDGDFAGKITFNAMDDGTPTETTYASIYSRIDDATNTEESGNLYLSVANHDGGLGAGLTLTGGSVNDEVDVEIGKGASSITTIAGDLDPNGRIRRTLKITDGAAAGEYDGDVVYTGSTTLMTTGACYYYTNAGTWALTNAGSTSSSTGLLAIALGDESDVDGMLLRGMVTTTAIAGTQDEGAILYLRASNGAITTDQASSGQVNRIVGYCMENSNNRIYFDPDKSWVELA